MKKAIRLILCCKEDKIGAKLVRQYSARLINFDNMCVGGWGYLIRILPPLFPFVSVVGGDGQITDGGVKPHVEHLQRQKDLWVKKDAFFLQLIDKLTSTPAITILIFFSNFIYFFLKNCKKSQNSLIEEGWGKKKTIQGRHLWLRETLIDIFHYFLSATFQTTNWMNWR